MFAHDKFAHFDDVYKRESEALKWDSMPDGAARDAIGAIYTDITEKTSGSLSGARINHFLPLIYRYTLLDKQELREGVVSALRDILFPLAGLVVNGEAFSAQQGPAQRLICAEAEPRFLKSLNRVYGLTKPGYMPISVFHTGSPVPEPLLFYKNIGETTALTLKPIEVSGLTLPAGVIVGLDLASMDMHNPYKQGSIGEQDVSTYLVDDDSPLVIEPRRLSPWAYANPMDRAMFGIESRNGVITNVLPERQQLAADYTIGNFRVVAQHIMAVCGVIDRDLVGNL